MHWRLVVLLLLSACSQPTTQSSSKAEGTYDEAFTEGIIHTIYAGSAVTSIPHLKTLRSRVIALAVGSLAAASAADLLSTSAFGQGSSAVTYHVMLEGYASGVSISNREIVNALRKKRQVLLNKSLEDLLDEDGTIRDTFIKDLLITWGYQNASPAEKADLVQQIHEVLTYDRDDVSPSLEDLKSQGISNPKVRELSIAMNGIRMDSYTQRELQARIGVSQQVNGVVVAGMAYHLSGLNDPTHKMMATGLWILASARVTSGAVTLSEAAMVTTPDGEDHIVDSDYLRQVFASYRLRYMNHEVNDLVDEKGGIENPEVDALMALYSGKKELTPEQKRDLVGQWLMILQSSREDTVEDLKNRGVTNEKLLRMFSNWKKISNP